MDTSLHTAAFTLSLRACFVEVGLLPKDDGSYVNFSYKKKGYLTSHIPQAPEIVNVDIGPTFGEVATAIELTNRPDDDGGSTDGSSAGGSESVDADEDGAWNSDVGDVVDV